MTNPPNRPPDDEFDDLDNLEWLNRSEVAPPPPDVDLFSADKAENVHGDRERDAGIGQAQYGRLVRRRMEDAIEKAEAAEFGDPNQLLDWMSNPQVSEQDLPEWLRAQQAPPAWLEGMDFSGGSSSSWTASLPSVPDVPLWSPPKGDTGGLADDLPPAVRDLFDTRPLTGASGDTGWLERTRFAADRSTATLPDPQERRYHPEAFGLAGVDPLRTDETASLNLVDDLFDPHAMPDMPGTEDDDPGAAARADADWDELMALFPPTAADLAPDRSEAPSRRSSIAQPPPADQPDLDALLNDIPAAPARFDDRLGADDEAISTLPRSDYTLDPSASTPPQESVPAWLREADLFTSDDRDWLEDFDQPTSSGDPLADLELPPPSPQSSSIRTLANLESKGASPDWLARLRSDALPDIPNTESTFGGRRYGLSHQEMDDMLSGSARLPAFDEPAQSLKDDSPRSVTGELDELLASMRSEQEADEGRIPSYADLFDSDLFDNRSIAELADEPRIARGTGNLDDLFASGLFDTSEIATLDEELPARADLREMFDENREDLLADIQFNDHYVSEHDLPAWMQGAQDGLGNSALAAALRSQHDRPLAELDDRLLALREDGMSLRVEGDAAGGLITQILPGVPEVLTPAPITLTSGELSTGLNVTDAHRSQAALLQALLSDAHAAPARQRHTHVRPPVLRLFVMVLLAAAVLLPLAVTVRVAPPPLASFAGAREAAFVTTLNQVPRGALVLLAVEYDASHAFELDELTETTLRHLRLRGARPVVISSSSVGITRVDQMLERVFPGGANRDYFLTRLIASGTIGLRDLAGSAALLNLDADGAPNGLSLSSLDDFAAGVLISASVETNRTYVEQVVPLMAAPFLLASTFAALPPSMAYYTAGLFDGVLAGYRDGVIYAAVVEAASRAPEAAPSPTLPTLPPLTPTLPPLTPTLPPLTPTLPPLTPTLPPPSPMLPPPSPTLPPPSPTLPPATETPVATHTPTSAPLVLVGTIVADERVNVRQNPSAGGTPVIATLEPGAVVRVLNFNDDRSWVSVVLPDDRIGWVAAFLIRVEERLADEVQFPRRSATYRRAQQATPEPLAQVGTALLDMPVPILSAPSPDAPPLGFLSRGDVLRVLVVSGDYASVVLPDNRIGFVETFALDIRTQAAAAEALPAPGLTLIAPTPTLRPTATPTPSATPTPTATPLPRVVAVDAPPNQPIEVGARWQSQFFGVMAASAIILAGNLFYLIRAILTRRKRAA